MAAGLGYFLLAPAFAAQYGMLYSHLAEPATGLLQAITLLLALVLLSPAAFFMGGTLPVLSAWLVRHPAALGRLVPLLYGVNTAGAAIGALSAAFLLPPLLGHGGSYLLALALASGIALTAWWLGGRGSAQGHCAPSGTRPSTRWSGASSVFRAADPERMLPDLTADSAAVGTVV
ncbi:MAG: hypothetical protein PVJ30_07260 [Thiohalocapsa sp.]|jgi:spermidine synthase